MDYIYDIIIYIFYIIENILFLYYFGCVDFEWID